MISSKTSATIPSSSYSRYSHGLSTFGGIIAIACLVRCSGVDDVVVGDLAPPSKIKRGEARRCGAVLLLAVGKRVEVSSLYVD